MLVTEFVRFITAHNNFVQSSNCNCVTLSMGKIFDFCVLDDVRDQNMLRR